MHLPSKLSDLLTICGDFIEQTILPDGVLTLLVRLYWAVTGLLRTLFPSPRLCEVCPSGVCRQSTLPIGPPMVTQFRVYRGPSLLTVREIWTVGKPNVNEKQRKDSNTDCTLQNTITDHSKYHKQVYCSCGLSKLVTYIDLL